MLNSVYGKLEYVMANRAIISTSLGLEFDITVSARTASVLLNRDDCDNVRLLVILQPKEDAVLLYGFLTEEERSLFTELVAINGIGAKQALKILSALSAQEFIECLDSLNIKSLSSIPGLGLKTAQKIMLALRDKLIKPDKKNPDKKSAKEKAVFSAIQESLQDMGFDKDRVKSAVEKCASSADALERSNPQAFEEEVFKSAFMLLSSEK